MNRVPQRNVPAGVRAVRLIALSTQETVIGIPDFGNLSFSGLQVFGRPAAGERSHTATRPASLRRAGRG